MKHLAETRPKVAIVVSHPIQHFCPLYRAVTLDGRLGVKVFFGSRAGVSEYFDRHFGRKVAWGGSILDGYEHEFLPGAEAVRDPSRSISCDALSERLDGLQPDAVVSYGYFHGIARAAYAWARARRRRAYMISDSDDRSRRDLLSRLRWRLVVPAQLKRVDGFLTVGDANERFYMRYGARRDQFFRSPFPVDESLFGQARTAGPGAREEARRGLGVDPSGCLFLAVGKLRELKRHADAISALAIARRRGGPGLQLAIVGDGPERRRLETLAASIAPGAVKFVGFQAPEQLPAWYLAADVLVHPSSQDRHPLTISEAVMCGLPCIVSDKVGSVGPTDDARPGVNCIEIGSGDVPALADAMLLLGSDAGLRGNMARGSLGIAAERSMKASVDGFVRAVLTGLASAGGTSRG